MAHWPLCHTGSHPTSRGDSSLLKFAGRVQAKRGNTRLRLCSTSFFLSYIYLSNTDHTHGGRARDRCRSHGRLKSNVLLLPPPCPASPAEVMVPALFNPQTLNTSSICTHLCQKSKSCALQNLSIPPHKTNQALSYAQPSKPQKCGALWDPAPELRRSCSYSQSFIISFCFSETDSFSD